MLSVSLSGAGTYMSNSLHVVCPKCQTTNRIPDSRLTDGPKCGKCHEALFNGHPVILNSVSFEQHIKNNNIPVLVDFWADWCGPCKMMAPSFQQAAQILEPHVRLAKVNTEIEQAISTRYTIRSIPTLILFQNGQEISRQSGAMKTQDIVHWTQSNMR